MAALLAERGVLVTDETIRQWSRKFGQTDANTLRRHRPRPGDEWHRDEVFIGINGVQHSLWRAVDQDGNVLDILVQRRRDKAAARKFFRRLLQGLAYVPRVAITDTLASYGAAKREVLPSVEHRQHKRLNNRAENAHQPTRDGSGGCGAARVRGTPSASSPPTARSPATASPPTTTANNEMSAAPPGGRSPAPRPWPESL